MPSESDSIDSSTPGTRTGATLADVILRILGSRSLVVALLLVIAGLIASVGFGFLEVSWGSEGVKVTPGERGGESADLNIAGSWRAEGKDLSDSDRRLLAKYTYAMTLTFAQKGEKVQLKGTYVVNQHPELPQRSISGRARCTEIFFPFSTRSTRATRPLLPLTEPW